MSKVCIIAYALFNNKPVSYNIYKSTRFFHSSALLNILSNTKINDYLLSRTIPASEVLNALTMDDKARLEVIKLEHQNYLANGEMVPDSLRDIDLLELLCLTYFQRKKYYSFLRKKQFSKQNDIIKKSNKIPRWKDLYPETEVETTKITNKFCGKYYAKYERKFIKQRLFNAIILKSQEIVFDFSFENEMTRHDVKNLSFQFRLCFSINKLLKDPFQIFLTSLQTNSLTYCDINKAFVGDLSKVSQYNKVNDFPLIIHEEPYSRVFPDKKLIYLSPDSTKKFQPGEYDHDAIYIIGALIDRSEKHPLGIAKARIEGLEHRSLPIDDYVRWKSGFRGLPLNQVFQIISMARESSGDWKTAIQQTIPSRKIYL